MEPNARERRKSRHRALTRLLPLLLALLLLPAAAGAQAKQPPLLGVVYPGDGTAELARLDARSLRPLPGTRLRAPAAWSLVARSPSGATLALIALRERGSLPEALLTLVADRGLRPLGRLSLGPAYVAAGLWSDPARLVLVLAGETPEIVVVDPAARRVLERRPLEGWVTHVERAQESLVLLLSPSSAIGPSRLAIVDASGAVRLVGLDVESGATPPSEEGTLARNLTPGLAIDRAGRRAVVVSANGGPLALVDLSTLAVIYRAVGVRRAAAAQKSLAGSVRSALWLGDRTVAVSGLDYEPYRDGSGREQQRSSAAGLVLVDPTDGAARTVDPRATEISRAGDLLLAYGSTWDSAASVSRGLGLVGYAADGTRRFHLFAEAPIQNVTTAGGWTYVASPGNRFRIVDARRGRIVAAPVTRFPTTLLSEP